MSQTEHMIYLITSAAAVNMWQTIVNFEQMNVSWVIVFGMNIRKIIGMNTGTVK